MTLIGMGPPIEAPRFAKMSQHEMRARGQRPGFRGALPMRRGVEATVSLCALGDLCG